MSAPSNNNNDNNNEGKNNSGGDKQSTISSWFNSLFQHDVRDEIHDKLNIFDDWKEEQERRQKEYEKRMISSSHQQHPFFRGHPFFVDPSPPLPPTNSANIDAEDFVGSSNAHDHNHNSANDDIHREMQNLLESMVGGAFFPPSTNSRSSTRSSTRSSNNNYSSSFDDFFLDNNNIGGGGGNSSSDATTTIVSSSSSSSMNGGLVSSYRMQQDSKNGTQIDIQFQNKNQRKKNDNDDDSTCIHNIAVEVLQERPCVIQWRKSPNNSNSYEKHRKKKNIERDSMMFRRGFGIIPDNHNNNSSSSSNDNNNVIELGDTIDCSKLSASVSEAENIILTLKAPIRASNNNSTKSLKQPKEDIAGFSRTPRSVPVLPK